MKGPSSAAGGEGERRLSSDELLPIVYQELHTLAASMLSAERAKGGIIGQGGSGTLQPTVLVHEAYLRLIGPPPAAGESASPADWQNRRHFFGAAAIAMRRILIDRARHLRGLAGHVRGDGGPSVEERSLPGLMDGEQPVGAGHPHGMSGGSVAGGASPDAMLNLDTAMQELAKTDPRRHEVVMLRFFAGLTVEQTASVLDLSAATVKSDWSFARAWLLRRIDTAGSGGTGGP